MEITSNSGQGGARDGHGGEIFDVTKHRPPLWVGYGGALLSCLSVSKFGDDRGIVEVHPVRLRSPKDPLSLSGLRRKRSGGSWILRRPDDEERT